MVLEADRGSLPFVLVHGEPLVACAAWALGEAGATLVDLDTAWEDLVDDRPLVLHDALCPLTPPDFLVDCVERAEATGAVVVGVRPVTDTIKRVVDGHLAHTVDRTGLLQVSSPVVLPAAVLAAVAATLDDALAASAGDLAALVADLAARHPVTTVEAPVLAGRVADTDDVRVLEALSGRPAPTAPVDPAR